MLYEKLAALKAKGASGLNPCSNGICSTRKRWPVLQSRTLCLNPCSNGICSTSTGAFTQPKAGAVVLILVLMEYALRAIQECQPHPLAAVLILVLMEYALRALIATMRRN